MTKLNATGGGGASATHAPQYLGQWNAIDPDSSRSSGAGSGMRAAEYIAPQYCKLDAGGKPRMLNNSGTPSCTTIRISGVDKSADLLHGGIDGDYKTTSCYDGHPVFTRTNSPKGEDRVLFYSLSFADWDISKGNVPDEADVIMYGEGEGPNPLHIKGWRVGNDLSSKWSEESQSSGSDDYYDWNATVECEAAAGSTPAVWMKYPKEDPQGASIAVGSKVVDSKAADPKAPESKVVDPVTAPAPKVTVSRAAQSNVAEPKAAGSQAAESKVEASKAAQPKGHAAAAAATSLPKDAREAPDQGLSSAEASKAPGVVATTAPRRLGPKHPLW